MQSKTNSLQICAALLVALSIGLGAFGAHGLRSLLDTRSFEVYETAGFYLLIQSVALLWLSRYPKPAALLIAGMLLFSGSLYLLSTYSLHQLPVAWLGPVTPIGGLLMIAAWVWASWLHFVTKKEERQA
ncbi:MAG: DUF423 domain-containing protein [Bacteroidia bacterium]